MYGQDCYTHDRVPPEPFAKRLREVDPGLVAAWNKPKEQWDILRANSSQFEPYSVVLECVETRDTGVWDPEGKRVVIRQAWPLDARVIKRLHEIDGQQGDADDFIDRMVSGPNEEARRQAEKKRRAMSAKGAERLAYALYKDLNISKPKIAFGVGSFHGDRQR